MKGTVKWFNSQKGYGFIEADSGQDIFIHYSNINKEGFRYLLEDDIVSFDLGTNKDGREQAVNVAPILTKKMIEDELRKDGLYLKTMRDAYKVRRYLIVDENNVLQTSECGMTVDELIDYLNNK